MTAKAQVRHVALAKRQTIILENAYGATIDCRQGNIWLSQFGDSRDIVLNPGDRFQFDRSAVIVISALTAAELSLCKTPAPPLLSAGWLGLPARLLRCLVGQRWRAAANSRMWMQI